MAQGEASDTTKRAAITLCVLSVAVGVTGNFFLGFVGVMCGGLHYCNNGSALDLLFMLSFLTSVLGMVHLFSVLSLGTITLFLDPKRVCGLSESMLDAYEPGRQGQAVANPSVPSGGPIVAVDGHPPVGYPWNMTESSMGHVASYGHAAMSHPVSIKGLQQGEAESVCP